MLCCCSRAVGLCGWDHHAVWVIVQQQHLLAEDSTYHSVHVKTSTSQTSVSRVVLIDWMCLCSVAPTNTSITITWVYTWHHRASMTPKKLCFSQSAFAPKLDSLIYHICINEVSGIFKMMVWFILFFVGRSLLKCEVTSIWIVITAFISVILRQNCHSVAAYSAFVCSA